MFALLKQTRTGFFVGMIGLMLVSMISPVLALAANDLVPGDDAVVLNDTRLFSETSRESNVTAEVAKDTPVSVVEGPFTTDNGTQWYWVRVYDQTGYMAAVDLDGVEAAPPAEAPADTAAPETPATRPWQEPIDYGVATDNVACRADVSTSAQELIRIAPGQTLEITGQEVWYEAIAWLPVNCAGVGGFIASDYITVNTPTEVATEVPTEVVTEVATEIPTEVVTEVATEVPTEVATDVPTEVVTEVAAETQVATDAAATEAPAETAGPTEAGAAQPSTGTALATDDVVCRVGATATSAQITVFASGQTIEVTGVAVDVDGMSWTPVNCAGVGGFVASLYITSGEVATETPVVEETATTEPTDEATGEATETPVVEETATGEPTDEATEEATETPVVEETATTEPTDEATEEATETPVVEEILDSGQAVVETESTMPVEDSAIIGTALIQDTGGAGVACRVAPDGAASIIRVLPEGMSVLVLTIPDANGWMSIVCNDQVGFAPSAYLWQGGAASDFTADKASFANVSATGGAGLNCRSGPGTDHSVIGYFPAGSGINVRGAAQGSWVPVVCGGQNGWVHGDFLVPASTPDTGTGTGGDTGNATSGTMVVSNTDGASLYCRDMPNGTAITLMAPGTRVTVRGAAENGWMPIVCAGQNGYASAMFLSSDTSGGGGDNGGGNNGGDNGTPSSGTVTVSGTGGVRLNCRTAPNGSVILSVAEGTVLTVRGAAEGDWLPVSCSGANGWVSTLFVTAGGTAPGGGDGGDPGSGNNGGTDPSTGTATVVNTDGDSLRCRTAPSGSTITMLAPGATVTLRAETSGAWQGVICANQNGYAHSDFLSTGGGSTNPTPTPTPDPEPSGLGNGDHAKTTATLNLRYEPSMGAGVATAAPAGTVVLITGGASSGFYPVDWDGLKGYMSGDFLMKTDEALSERGGSGQPTDPGSGNGGGGTATGNAIVDYAMGYVGYPYVWATHGPYSFDCSGFTYWVIKNVVGVNIGTGTWSQVSAGTPVSRNALQPGDLVFFQNTYASGLSHVGIYIGGDQFVHAENESTGVKVSSLSSNYYGSRWYGAVRIT